MIMSIKKTLCILLAVLFLVAMTAASASAWNSKKATTESISTPKKAEVGTSSAPKADTTVSTEPKKAIVEVKEEGPTVNCDKNGCFVTSLNYGYTSGDADFSKYFSPDVSKKIKELYGVA
jgi:hypothetical protein